ncbi:MAG: protein kinase [Planctomycetes bacterium]|nr:protein kinase [Planctomycetota bacterium]
MSNPPRDPLETRPAADTVGYGPTAIHPVGEARPAATHPAAPPLPEEAARVGPEARFDKFVRTRRVGTGGMGEVWRAWDTELGRWVALKFMREQDDPNDVARFQREARLAGQLGHPHIAQVYETGVANGRYFIAMPFIDGVTLLQFPWKDRRAAIGVIRDAALAVDFAHRAGVIHRDLKPANIMVTTVKPTGRKGSGKRIAEHHVYVMDFGLARSTRRGQDASVSGDVVGTPAYMPPEQARGERVGPPGDVYALGATLYEILTGMPPIVAPTAAETLRRIVNDSVRRPSTLDRTIDRELETIVMKCLEKEARTRYRTAADLADDLTRWLTGEAIHAHLSSPFYRLRKGLAKKRGVVTALAAGVALAAVLVGVGGPAVLRARAAQRAAERDEHLWREVAGPLFQAELLSRAGEHDAAERELDAGAAICREAIASGETAAGHYFLGRFLRLRGLTPEAVAEFGRVLELDPRFGEAHLERGLVRVQDYAARVDALLIVAPTSWRTRGELYTQLDRLDPGLPPLRAEALSDLTAEIGQSSYFRQADALYGKAELARARGEEAAAAALLKDVLELDPAHTQAMVAMSKIELEAGRPAEAESWATRAAERDLGDPEPLLVRARAIFRRWEEEPEAPLAGAWAMQWPADAAKAIALGAKSAEALTYRADGRREAGKLDAAERDYDAALKLRPGYGFARRGKGLVALARGDFSAAVTELALAEAELQGSPRTLLLLGRARVGAGDLNGAWEDFSRILNDQPGYLQARLGRALVQERRGSADAALAELNQAVDEAPGSFEARWWRARLRFTKEDMAGSLQDLRELLDASPSDVEALTLDARVLLRLGRLEEARVVLARSLRLDPTADRWRLKGDIENADGRVVPALSAYGEALSLSPKDLEALLCRAAILERLGQLEDALRDFRAADAIARDGSEEKRKAAAAIIRLSGS